MAGFSSLRQWFFVLWLPSPSPASYGAAAALTRQGWRRAKKKRGEACFGGEPVVTTNFLCANPDNPPLCHLAHKFILCSKSDIAILSESAHNGTGVKIMSDLARTPKQIGNLVRRTRKKRGLSQTQLGNKAGLRQETISLIETGNPAARLDTILSVLAALDLEFRVMPRSKGTPSDIEDIF
jgi:HTH-type transcriptional regulator/antitoxin HipB